MHLFLFLFLMRRRLKVETTSQHAPYLNHPTVLHTRSVLQFIELGRVISCPLLQRQQNDDDDDEANTVRHLTVEPRCLRAESNTTTCSGACLTRSRLHAGRTWGSVETAEEPSGADCRGGNDGFPSRSFVGENGRKRNRDHECFFVLG
jgi:hypothetical protein